MYKKISVWKKNLKPKAKKIKSYNVVVVLNVHNKFLVKIGEIK